MEMFTLINNVYNKNHFNVLIMILFIYIVKESINNRDIHSRVI